MKERKLRRSGGKIMAGLISMLGSLAYVMVFAVINGTLGYICAMGVTVSGAVAVAKLLGENIALSYYALMGIAVGCGVMRGILRYAEQYCNHYIAFKILAALRDKIFGALRRLCPAKLESKKKGSIIAMITADIETLEVYYAHTISPICIAVTVSTAVLVFAGVTSSWYISLTALIGYAVIAFALPAISSKKLNRPGVEYRREFVSFNAYYMDSIKGVRDVLLSGSEKKRKNETDRRTDILLEKTRKIKRLSSRSSAVTALVISLFIAATLAVAAALVLTGGLSAGKAVIGVVAVFGSFGPVTAIAALPGNLNQTFAGGDRVLDLIEEAPAVQPISNGTDISFERTDVRELTFSYGEEQVLNGVNVKAEKGETVGIVGASGCGKSTLLKLMLRFWNRSGGEIEYNGVSIDKVNTASLINEVTLVSQSTYLFNETVLYNLLIAKPDATREEVEKACRMAGIHDFIMTLPDGYDSKVAALSDNLSAGEQQRIGLARAFLRGSELLLLDEPTSNVDSINEGIILRALKENCRDKAVVLVSHRESTIAGADRVYQIEKGKAYERK